MEISKEGHQNVEAREIALGYILYQIDQVLIIIILRGGGLHPTDVAHHQKNHISCQNQQKSHSNQVLTLAKKLFYFHTVLLFYLVHLSFFDMQR
jgi:hypothetical protein